MNGLRCWRAVKSIKLPIGGISQTPESPTLAPNISSGATTASANVVSPATESLATAVSMRRSNSAQSSLFANSGKFRRRNSMAIIAASVPPDRPPAPSATQSNVRELSEITNPRSWFSGFPATDSKMGFMVVKFVWVPAPSAIQPESFRARRSGRRFRRRWLRWCRNRRPH